MAEDKTIKWFHLQRFHAALKVVPMSPLRGITMTCLEVVDQKAFTEIVHRDLIGSTDDTDVNAKVSAWRERLAELGFGPRPEFFDHPDLPDTRGFRLYSNRSTFTLAEIQKIVPGVTSDDFAVMPISQIVHGTSVPPELVEEWKRFAEIGLANEAVDVWAPKVSPFDKPYAEARTITQVWEEHSKNGGRFRGIDAEPTSRWFAGVLERALYRENSLVGFYADKEYALADGHKEEDLQQVYMPYALPLLVERTGRIVALRDVRYAPEVISQPPRTVIGFAADTGEGVAVKPLLAVREVAAIYREEAAKWQAWHESSDAVDVEALGASLKRVVEADRDLCERFTCIDLDRIAGLLDGNYARIAGPQPVKPIGEWDAENFRLAGMRAKRYLNSGPGTDNGVEPEYVVYLRGLDARVRAQIAEHAREVAQDALKRVAESVQVTPVVADKAKVRHEDTGEKIGGARKDFHRRAMTADDLEGMNDFERKSLVLKKNVWPPLDYEAMRDAGVEPQAAVAIKYLKDSINVEPDRKHSMRGVSNDPEADYIEAVGKVREVMQTVRTLDEFKKACFDLRAAGAGDSNYIYGGSPLQVQLGSDTCHLLADARAEYGYGANQVVEPYLPRKIQREIRKRVREDAEWDYLIKPKREKTDAEKDADSERGEKERELHRPHLDVVQRIGGEDWRSGRDIVAQDLIDHFGFRAVEFGNWLPQDERQTVLNMAFDSLCDLASALEIPPKGVSLGGELAVAFGSRGRGGKNAALAHFEPGRFVINLTRMKGAGTLAHEWFHGLDFHLGGNKSYATKQGRPRFDNDPLPGLVSAMFKRAAKPEEIIEKTKKDAELGRDYTASWCYHQSPDTRVKIKDTLQECFDRARAVLYEESVTKLTALRDASGKNAGVHPHGVPEFETRHRLAEQIVQTVRAKCDDQKAFTKVRPKVEANVTWMVQNMASWLTVEAARDIGFDLTERFYGGANAVETDYLKAAKALDDTRSSPYWATEIELFARAGAQYVHYALAERGVRSDYLVYGAEVDRYKDHEIGNPNPSAEDRATLQGHFAALVDDFRVRLLRSMEVSVDVEP